jgi:hypothetical protein
MQTKIYQKRWREEDNSEDISVDGSIILKWIFNKDCESEDWIRLSRKRGQLQDL